MSATGAPRPASVNLDHGLIMHLDRQYTPVICRQNFTSTEGGWQDSYKPPEGITIHTPPVNAAQPLLFTPEQHPKHGWADLVSSHKTPGGIVPI